MDSLTQLALMWAAAFLAILVASKTRLTNVLWYLIFGAVLVNLGVLPEKSDEFITTLSELGIILIMFALGFEERTDHFLSSMKKSWGIALFGALVPFFTAYFLTDWFWGDRNISIMCGLAMTATAVSLTMVSLKSEGLGRSVAATRIMTSAVLDVIASLVALAIMIPIATGQASFEISDIGLIILKTILFFMAISVLGQWLLPRITNGWLGKVPLIGYHGFADVISVYKGKHSVLSVLLLALLIGLLAHTFGFHPAIGAYMAGLVLKEEYFHHPADDKLHKHTSFVVDIIAFSVFGPIFFINLGSKLLFDWPVLISIFPHTVLLTLSLFVAQVSSASLAARFTSSMNWAQSLMVGFGMLGRAELAFVVMDIAYIEHKILSTEAFYTLMLTAFWLNIAVPVSIKLWKPVYQRHTPE
ncbi:MAG: cation:proton antiporter [Hyphomicrobiaceae bacterium]|nr:cation:proton antiporter [Hyphomicrobiaceae bacterium]